jgi:predicted DNA-binding transcriptional regulator YafY
MERNIEIVRQWRILKAIEAASDRTIPKLAQTFKVCTRTIRRDLDALQEAGFPLYVERVDNKVYWRLAGKPFKALADTAFTLSELCAFHVDRTRLAMAGGSPVEADLQAAIAKLTAALSPQMKAYLDKLSTVLTVKVEAAAGGSAATAATLQEELVLATLDHRKIEITYHSFASRRVKQYCVEPYRLTFGNGGLYLFAYVPSYGQMRTFAVQRIKKLRMLEERFNPVETASGDPYRHSLGVFNADPEVVEIEFAPGVAPYIEERQWHPSQKITRRPDGSIVLRMNISVDVSLRSWILGFGHAARVLKPPILADTILEELEEAREQYAPSMQFEMPPPVYRSSLQPALPFGPGRAVPSRRGAGRAPRPGAGRPA